MIYQHVAIKVFAPLIILILSFGCLDRKKNEIPEISLEKFGDGIHHWDLYQNAGVYERLKPDQVIEISDNLIAYQNPDGGWPKNIDWLSKLNPDSVKAGLTEHYRQSTLDNDNTFPQIEYLSEVYLYTGKKRFKISAQKGIEYLLNTQNVSGGWRGWDVDAITFNDNVTTGVMNLFLDIIQNSEPCYDWIDEQTFKKIERSFNRALSATLKSQIVVNDEKTAWCQQHDHHTYKPVKARSYEYPSIVSRESVSIVDCLMKIENPTDSVKDAIKAAVKWFEKSKLYGFYIKKIPFPKDTIVEGKYKYDRIIVEDTTAPPIWARFYNIETNLSFLSKRDGTLVYKLSEVDLERRAGYAWYGYWPREILEEKYPQWLEKHK